MREDTVTTTVYKFDELSDAAKQTAINVLGGVNVTHDWWDSTYEDAAQIGLVIEEFDIDRGSYCRGKWTEDAEDVASLIMENHGACCETHKDAWEFQNAVSVQGSIFEAADDFDPESEQFIESEQYASLCEEFQRTIREDYRIMLQQEYEYQTSEEAIIGAIKVDGYEFRANGELY